MAYGEPCASRGARTVREGASTRRLPHDLYNTSDTRAEAKRVKAEEVQLKPQRHDY